MTLEVVFWLFRTHAHIYGYTAHKDTLPTHIPPKKNKKGSKKERKKERRKEG